jgi:uncharacterized membrane protein YbhN (UPF0104 family)
VPTGDRARAGAGPSEIRRATPAWRQVLRSLGGVLLAVALLWWGLPRVTGASWPATTRVLAEVPTGYLVGLFALLVGAWACYGVVLTAALPGLSLRRAVLLNLASSAVSMLVPFGGAVGVGATYLITRSWGFSLGAIGLSVIVTGLWNVMAKLAIPLVGLAALALAGEHVDPQLARAATVGALVVAGILAALVGVLAADRVAQVADRFAARWAGRWFRPGAVLRWRDRSRTLLRDGWARMTAGMAGFLALYGVLFWASLQAVHAQVPGTVTVAAYTLGRLLTSVVVTPGGLGIAESGAAGLLVSFGAPAPIATAGVLLFAAYTQLVQVPAGAIAWAGWAISRRRAGRQ